MITKPLSILMILLLTLQTGCYNTYTVKMDEFRKIQESDEDSTKGLIKLLKICATSSLFQSLGPKGDRPMLPIAIE